ncbi:DHA2 family efflux MFS transporter permease subunit [Plantactinospora siamensis]|uniref:DHA2 family efflux MFS transporter permease subunit n=1 Tax=Plantactinospora siamensis TaxID=555372 RepID=A0ABV6NW00_9ACTN
MTAPAERADRKQHSPWLVLSVLCLGFFMILLDTTIVNIAIPDMSTHLSASLDQILWVINAYVLVYAVLLITAGRLGDLYGPKRLFILGLVIFTLASAACGFARNPEQLIVARVIQGAGGALLTPQSLSVITMIFPAEKRGAAFGLWGAVAGVATVAGPTLGGYLVTDWGWEYIFFVNLPIGIVAVVLAAIVMPDIKLNRRHRLDWLGTALASVGLFLVTFGLIEGEPHDWGRVLGPITIVEVIAAGVVVLVAFMFQQYANRNREPLVPFAIFSDRNYSLMNFVSGAIAFGMLGLFLPLVIYLQSVLGLTALQAGLTTAPMSLISMFVAPLAGRFSDRTGGKWILFLGLSLWSVGMGMVVWLAHFDSGRWHILPGIIVAGFGLGMTFAPLQTIAMRNVAPQMAGAASGFINTSRQLGGVIGSAAVGALLQVQLADQLRSTARTNAGSLPPQFRDAFVNGFSHASGGSLQVGAGQSGVPLPPGLPEQARQVIGQVATRTFHQAFTGAMRHSLVLPLAVLAAAALCCLFISTRASRGTAAPAEPEPVDAHA